MHRNIEDSVVGALAAIVLLIGQACRTADSPQIPISAQDLAVIKAALSDPNFRDAYGMRLNPVLLERTELSGLAWGSRAPRESRQFARLSGGLIEVPEELVRALIERNTSSTSLRSVISELPIRLARRRDLSQLKPSRVVTISMPAFSTDNTMAVVAITRGYSAPCCPEGYSVLLQNSDGVWRVIAHGGFWVV